MVAELPSGKVVPLAIVKVVALTVPDPDLLMVTALNVTPEASTV